MSDTTNTHTTMRVPTRRERRPGRISVRVLDAGDPHPIVVNSNVVTIGRSHLADVHAPHASVSKLHCRLSITDVGLELIDLDSKNGTWLRQQRLFHVTVSTGDIVTAGQCRIEILSSDIVEVDALESSSCGAMFGASLMMRELFARLHRLSSVDAPAVFLGEIGVGKEMAARTLHALSRRAGGPFVVLDAAILPRSGLEDVLLKREPSTAGGGATALEQARGGTLFIDNIDEFPLAAQSMLLRLIQQAPSSEFDFRVMASTRQDLRQVVIEDRLREDLYYQIAPAVVEIPPLRKRREDIAPLVRELLADANAAHGRRLELGDQALTRLVAHHWSGNVRELRGVINRAVIEAQGPVISTADIVIDTARSLPIELLLTGSYDDIHRAVDRHLFPLVVENTCYNISKVAERLGINRRRVRTLLQEHGLYPFAHEENS